MIIRPTQFQERGDVRLSFGAAKRAYFVTLPVMGIPLYFSIPLLFGANPSIAPGYILPSLIFPTIWAIYLAAFRITADVEGIRYRDITGQKSLSWSEIRTAKHQPGVGPRANEIDGPLSMILIESFERKGILINARIFEDKNLHALMQIIAARAAG